MRLLLEDILRELHMRLESEKSIRNSIYLKNAISDIGKYKSATESKPVD